LKSRQTIQVNLTDSRDRSYLILIQSDVLSRVAEALSDAIESKHVVVITDESVGSLYLNGLLAQLQTFIHRVDSIVIPSGEATKSLTVCEEIWIKLLALGADRKTTIFALGGGVIGDLAGYVAASYARGLDLVQIPTTLLAQVDSSVGGKVGINLPSAKNMVGAFWHPRRVLIDPAVLSTLEDRNYRAGLAEVVKYGVIMDPMLFEYLERNCDCIHRRDPAVLSTVIAWCCRCKASVVEEDERELTGRRAILNYGHTLGHAIEAVFGYGNFLHGEAVAIGMKFAAMLARELGLLANRELDRQSALLETFGLARALPPAHQTELLNAMRRDKKVSHGKLNLILPTTIGNVTAVVAPDDSILVSVLAKLETVQK
jgi:3-dehydroquinate synthase